MTPPLLVHAGCFAALSPGGDILGTRGTSPDGLFARDARHLSRWRLTADGAPPTVLVPARGTASTTAVLIAAGTRDEPSAWTLFRRQALHGDRLTERLELVNNTAGPLTVTLAVEAGADFADQFELRADDRAYGKPGGHHTVLDTPHGVEFGYHRGSWHSTTTVTADPPPDEVTPDPAPDSVTTDRAPDKGTPDPAPNTVTPDTVTPDTVTLDGAARRLTWRLRLPAHGSGALTLHITARPHGAPDLPPAPVGFGEVLARIDRENTEFTDPPPTPHPAVGDLLERACAQGIGDLARLRVPARGPDGEQVLVPAAGVPWFLTLFGRDSLLTSHFALPYRPGLAEATLLALAATQAGAPDPARVAEPGKIVHEIRHGELAHFREVPYGRYYGSVDSTPLFLTLLHAHAEQTRDTALARRLEPHARAAADWMLGPGGLLGHGYLVYRADARGLLNQNWKDSAGAICFTDGTQATGAVAVAEAQGYAYDALRRTAALARTVWHDTGWADRLDTLAEELRSRFPADFWMPDQEFPALALDGDGRRVDALASDAGHLLWSGILDPDRGRTVGRRLMRPDFFSGWGIRTLASGQAPYHPLSYHRGGIWPHDNAVIALGLARYGLHSEVTTLATALTDAAARHGHRLPEVMAGYRRGGEDESPVPYPHSCSPQAWAAATPLALRTALTAGTPPSLSRDDRAPRGAMSFRRR
ncbi:glycogen debranching N-terminal domain-containing protein [Streptomyces sp. NPDC051018]|uniref:amylo-alpha-1,6-glucosidase n=1 Tax=Streptomyces sp. NPDC051018 TaxID=3365639 RepID=UPI0037A65695